MRRCVQLVLGFVFCILYCLGAPELYCLGAPELYCLGAPRLVLPTGPEGPSNILVV